MPPYIGEGDGQATHHPRSSTLPFLSGFRGLCHNPSCWSAEKVFSHVVYVCETPLSTEPLIMFHSRGIYRQATTYTTFTPNLKIKLPYRKMHSIPYLDREDCCSENGLLIHSTLSGLWCSLMWSIGKAVGRKSTQFGSPLFLTLGIHFIPMKIKWHYKELYSLLWYLGYSLLRYLGREDCCPNDRRLIRSALSGLWCTLTWPVGKTAGR